MKDKTQNKILIFMVILLFISLPLTLKFGGASELPKFVEKDGYCKMTYGGDWRYNERTFVCYNTKSKEVNTFTESEFREVCPKVKILDLRFYSDCFKKGEAR